MLNIQLSKQSQKFLKTLPPKQQKQCALKLRDLKMNGHLSDTKQLKGSVFFRVDVGEYRIVYDIIDNLYLSIALVGRRNDNDVYKKLRRLEK